MEMRKVYHTLFAECERISHIHYLFGKQIQNEIYVLGTLKNHEPNILILMCEEVDRLT